MFGKLGKNIFITIAEKPANRISVTICGGLVRSKNLTCVFICIGQAYCCVDGLSSAQQSKVKQFADLQFAYCLMNIFCKYAKIPFPKLHWRYIQLLVQGRGHYERHLDRT